jgi:hypothetical protein
MGLRRSLLQVACSLSFFIVYIMVAAVNLVLSAIATN